MSDLHSPLSRRLLKGFAGLFGLGLFLCGLLGLGNLAFQEIRGWDRFALPFGAIECPAPPGQTRREFIDEVQYLGKMPDRLGLLKEGMARQLALAFGRHPWVERVEKVQVRGGGRIRVELTFRNSVLAVPEQSRVMDGQGILLPPRAPLGGVVILSGKVPPPAGAAGSPWGDPAVEGAARTVALLQSHKDQFHLEEIENTTEGLVLRSPWVRILWGRPPGLEKPAEASAARKVEWLLAFCREHGSLAGAIPAMGDVCQEHDVRLAAGAIHRLVQIR